MERNDTPDEQSLAEITLARMAEHTLPELAGPERQRDFFEPQQLSLRDELEALRQRVDRLEEDAFQRHVDRNEGMSY